jgi:hypothetical protein
VIFARNAASFISPNLAIALDERRGEDAGWLGIAPGGSGRLSPAVADCGKRDQVRHLGPPLRVIRHGAFTVGLGPVGEEGRLVVAGAQAMALGRLLLILLPVDPEQQRRLAERDGRWCGSAPGEEGVLVDRTRLARQNRICASGGPGKRK